ncbi:MAG: DUF4363 family protein [Oscillospiraceae bacterium]|nr:DUF4363 family protein [Oscillospiraceae bacterium]
MKRLWIAVAILLVMLGSTLGNSWYIDRTVSDFLNQLSAAHKQASTDNWERATQLTRQVVDHWQHHDFYFHVMLPHDDIDQIHLTFQEVEEYLELEEADQYNAASARLITQLGLLAEMEQLNLKNIL